VDRRREEVRVKVRAYKDEGGNREGERWRWRWSEGKTMDR
jgi:hypothetical protein